MRFSSVPLPSAGGSRNRILALALSALLIAAWAAATGPSANAAGTLNIYENSLKTNAGRAKIRQYGGGAACSRNGSKTALRVQVGKKTRECFMNVPVVGRDIQASIAGRIFTDTPKALRQIAWIAVNVRQARNGSRYQFLVQPGAKRFKLRKVNADGSVKVFAQGRDAKAIKPLGKANRLTLKAFNGVGNLPAGSARLVARVNGKQIVVATDEHGSTLEGRDTTISIGTSSNARGTRGSFNNAKVDIPDPY